MRSLPALTLCVLLAACAAAMPGSSGQPEGSPVRLGASVADVQRILGTSAAPVNEGSAAGINLPARGVHVLFDRQGQVSTVRMDAPFAAPVLGIRIGDTEEFLLQKMGRPHLKIRADGQTGFSYYPDPLTMLTYVVTPNQRIQTIFVER